MLPELVTAAASLASVAPYGADGLDYYAGMGQENVDDDRLFFTDEAAARAKTDRDREEILAIAPEDAAKAFESLLTPTDAAALRGRPGRIPDLLRARGPGARQPGMVGRHLPPQAVGIRPGRHRRPGPVAARQAGHVRAIRPRQMAGRAHSRRRGPAARRRRPPDAVAESHTRGACLAIRTPITRRGPAALLLECSEPSQSVHAGHVPGDDPQPLGELSRRQRLLRVHEPLHDDADEQGVQDRAGLARRLGIPARVDP